MLLAIRQQLPVSVSHWQTDQANSTIWLTPQARTVSATASNRWGLLHTPRVPPFCTAQPQSGFESLAAHIAQLSSGGHVLLAGDFNVRVDAAAQPWITDLSDDAAEQ